MLKDVARMLFPPKGGTVKVKICEHKFVFMETARQRGSSGYGCTEWKRIDRFYCEKCLEIKELKKTAPGWGDKPEWFD